jgi:hypothetical protein
MGNDNFWGNAVATVTFKDGSSTQVDSTDISFTVIPDMTTLGKKNVIVSYSKTKLGKYGQAASTLYSLEVTNSVTSLEITTMPHITEYHFFNSDPVLFNTKGLVVTATYSDGSTAIIPNSSLKFSTIPAVEGSQNAVISYVGATTTVDTNCTVNMIKGIGQVGNNDLATPWWTAFSDEYVVASGQSKIITMYCYSNGINNWHSPATILRKANMEEYAIVRMDNFGWGDGYATSISSNNWSFDTMASNINGAKVVITVTNKGDNTADILYNVTFVNGETHFQKYEGITVDSTDLNCALVIEGAYVVIVE